ncbi:class III signal peptide-containing protein [Candidatus Micrarchaeota archaeon]|nr:class III signal peptide-containing protein [Candidatus Micrarchaeota archaeon]
MEKKGQGMFEYILLLAGILLIVVLAIVVLRGGLFGGAETDIKAQNCQAALSRSSACYASSGAWNQTGAPTPYPPACVSINYNASADGCSAAFGDDCSCGVQPGA